MLFIFFVLLTCASRAQNPVRTDTATSQMLIAPESQTKYKHSPRTATLLSMALPGAGQVYNKKNWWWKVPIIYGLGGVLTYSVIFYNNNYNDFKDTYKYRIETGASESGDPRFDRFQTPTLKSIRDSYRQARDECIIGLVAVYVLQIVDASVEAHFFDFNVSDDLSLKVQPVFIPYGTYASAGIQFNLKLLK